VLNAGKKKGKKHTRCLPLVERKGEKKKPKNLYKGEKKTWGNQLLSKGKRGGKDPFSSER